MRHPLLIISFIVTSSLLSGCGPGTTTTLEPPGPSPAPTGGGTIEYVDGGRLYALVVATDASGSVASSRLEIVNLRDLSIGGGQDLGPIDASAIAVDLDARVFVADRTNAQIELDGVPFLLLDTPPDDVAVLGPFHGFGESVFDLAAAGAAGVDLYELDTTNSPLEQIEHVDVGGTARAIVFGSWSSLGVAVQGSGAELAVVDFGTGLPAGASVTPLGDASCPSSVSDVALAGGELLVWDAVCQRAYGSAGSAVFGSAGIAGLGSSARLRADGPLAVAADGARLDFIAAGAPATTVMLPSRTTSIAASGGLATVWAALDEPAAPRIVAVTGTGGAMTSFVLPFSGIVRDLEYLDRPPVIGTSIDRLRVDVCRSAKTVSFHVDASDADGDLVTLFVDPVPGATFDPVSGLYTVTISKDDGIGSIPLQAVAGRYLVTTSLYVQRTGCLELDLCRCSTPSGGRPDASVFATMLGALAILAMRRAQRS